jgi:hypothetical protein
MDQLALSDANQKINITDLFDLVVTFGKSVIEE